MSKSYKKAISKISGPLRADYWKIVRRRIKMAVKSEKEVIPNPKEVVNDYDYVDWVSNCENTDNCYCMRTYGFKKCKLK